MIIMKNSGNWKKKVATLLAFAMVATLSASPLSTRAATTVPAKAVTLRIADNVQVLITGKKYDVDYTLKPSGSTEIVTFKSSNSTIAYVNKTTGIVTAKKRGIVTITATTESGKKDYKVFRVIDPDCSTYYQATLDKMLVSSNITRPIIRNLTTAKNYIIKAGNYSNKSIYVRAPYSDVTNYGVFKKVTLVDVADGTWNELISGNYIKITDNQLRFVVGANAITNVINYTAPNGVLNLQAEGVVRGVKVTATNANVNIGASINAQVKGIIVTGDGAKVAVDADGAVNKVIIDSKADVVITGAKDKVAVQVTENAAGSTIKSSVAIDATVGSNVEIDLQDGAESSSIKKANTLVDFTVHNTTTEDIVITTNGSTETEVITPQATTVAVNGIVSTDGKSVSYTLPTTFDRLKSTRISVDALGLVNEEFTFTQTMLSHVMSYLSDDVTYLNQMYDKWVAMDSYTRTEGGKTLTISGSGLSKEVNIDGTIATVTIDAENNQVSFVKQGSNTTYVITKINANQVTIQGGTSTYTVTKVSNNELVITSSSEINLANFVALEVTY